MAGYAGLGTILRIDTGSGHGRLVAELTSISGPSVSLDTIDVSSHDSWQQGDTIDAVTFTNGTNTINCVGHGLQNGEVVAFRLGAGGALPAELSDDRWYYVINRAANTFQVSETFGGVAAAFTDDGSTIVNVFRASPYREYAGGLIDGGEVSLEGNLAELADADEIQGALDDRDELGFEIEFPTGDMWEFDGIVTAFETSAPHDDKLGFSASLKITGQPVLA
jgi:predicted secreted protein